MLIFWASLLFHDHFIFSVASLEMSKLDNNVWDQTSPPIYVAFISFVISSSVVLFSFFFFNFLVHSVLSVHKRLLSILRKIFTPKFWDLIVLEAILPHNVNFHEILYIYKLILQMSIQLCRMSSVFLSQLIFSWLHDNGSRTDQKRKQTKPVATWKIERINADCVAELQSKW